MDGQPAQDVEAALAGWGGAVGALFGHGAPVKAMLLEAVTVTEAAAGALWVRSVVAACGGGGGALARAHARIATAGEKFPGTAKRR